MGLSSVWGDDTAWTFESKVSRDEAGEFLRAQGWDGTSALLGVAPINPFCWPVKPSLAKSLLCAVRGVWDHHYRSWYFFSWSPDRQKRFERYFEHVAGAANEHARKSGSFVVVIGMEALDADAAQRLSSLLEKPCALVLSSSRDGHLMSRGRPLQYGASDALLRAMGRVHDRPLL